MLLLQGTAGSAGSSGSITASETQAVEAYFARCVFCKSNLNMPAVYTHALRLSTLNHPPRQILTHTHTHTNNNHLNPTPSAAVNTSRSAPRPRTRPHSARPSATTAAPLTPSATSRAQITASSSRARLPCTARPAVGPIPRDDPPVLLQCAGTRARRCTRPWPTLRHAHRAVGWTHWVVVWRVWTR